MTVHSLNKKIELVLIEFSYIRQFRRNIPYFRIAMEKHPMDMRNHHRERTRREEKRELRSVFILTIRGVRFMDGIFDLVDIVLLTFATYERQIIAEMKEKINVCMCVGEYASKFCVFPDFGFARRLY